MTDERRISGSRDIAAPPEVIFALLADARRHAEIDGSNTVRRNEMRAPERLALGAKFGMKMKVLGFPYRVTNTVVEFEQDRLIAWRHVGRHRWRYELEPAEGGTEVTESFDWASSRFPPFYEWFGYPARHEVNMTKTLERLEDVLSRS